jgi:hypothetical protein
VLLATKSHIAFSAFQSAAKLTPSLSENAFSPTFGGNATVGGTLTVSGTGLSSVLGSLSVAGQVISPANSTLVMDFVSGADQGRLLAKNSAGTYTNPILVVNPLTTSGNLTASGTLHTFGASNKAVIQMSAGTGALPAGGWIYGSDEGLGFSPNGTGLNKKLVMAYFDGSAYRSALEFENVSSGTATLKLSDYGGPTTVGGNLTVSGTGNNIFNSGGGNLLIGGVIDGGQKLQVNGTASFAGAVTAGSTITSSIAGAGAGFRIERTGGSASLGTILNTGGEIVHDYNSLGYSFRVSTVEKFNINATRALFTGKINAANLPTSASGLSAGDIWNDGGTLKIV